MPRLIHTTPIESPALLALRRSVWQLVVLGIATAMVLARIAPQYDIAAAWSVLIPLSALAVLYRRELLDLISARRIAVVPGNTRRRRMERKQPQARRATSDRTSTKLQQTRTQHAVG